MRLKNNTEIIIREIDQNDVNAYIDFKLTLADQTEKMMNKYPEEVDTDIETNIKKLTIDPESIQRHFAYYAFNGDKIVGFVCFGATEDTIKSKHRAYYGIGILEEYTSMGLGSELSRRAFDRMKLEGFTQCELEVIKGNDRAYRMYEKLGFKVYGERPNSVILKNGEVLSNILMYKVL